MQAGKWCLALPGSGPATGEAMSNKADQHVISPEEAGTLAGLFYERVKRSPDALAYRYYDEQRERWTDLSWAAIGNEVARWQAALGSENLQPGDRVAVMMQNCPEWVMFDQAALANGLVLVPLYTQDRAENAAYILQNSGAKLLLIGRQEHWDSLQPVMAELGFLNRIISLRHIDSGQVDERLKTAGEWLPDAAKLVRVAGDLKARRPDLHVIVTGRNAKPSLIEAADLVPGNGADELLLLDPAGVEVDAVGCPVDSDGDGRTNGQEILSDCSAPGDAVSASEAATWSAIKALF